MALPNPFQSTIVAPVGSPSIVKTAQNDTSFFHGYRSTFNIDQQKEQYQQQKTLQQQEHEQQHQHHYHQHPNNQNASKHQPNQFNRNIQHQRNHQPNRSAAEPAAPNRNPNHTANAGFVSNWCDLCERGFKFPHQLEKHRSEHEKCWFENCTFEGHTQLLKKHIEVQHQSGLFQRIVKVETDEDIEKWREERRKRYPTASNIEARRQAQEQRLKRGERIDEPTSRFGNINNRKRAQQHRPVTTVAKPNESIEPNVTNDVAKKRNDHKNRRRPRQRNKNNRAAIKERNECGKKNESETTQNKSAVVNTETASCVATAPAAEEKMAQNSSALAAIMGMYGSESDSNDEDDHNDDEVLTAVTMTTAIDTEKMIEDKTDENASREIDPVDELDKLTLTESNVTEEAVNLKRPADSDADELPSKQTKIDADVIENFKQNMTIESDDDDDAPDEQPIQRQSQVIQDTDGLVLKSGPTETKPVREATPSQRLTNERIPKRKTVLDTTRKIRNQNTLLEKLLQKDIRHERNVLLQCVRYVVQQNFFGIGQTIDEQNSKSDSL